MTKEGLPTVELFVARAFFKAFCFFKNDEAAYDHYDQESKYILELIKDVSKRDKPITISRIRGIEEVSRHWSINMTLHHLVHVTSDILAVIRELQQRSVPDMNVVIAEYKPPKEISSDIEVEFVKTTEQYLKQISVFGKLNNDQSFSVPHPWFGPLTAHGWHCLTAMHQGIHRRQIAAIRSLL